MSQGQPAILSAPWYLNYINYGVDWINYYNVDPLGFDTGNDDDKLLMYGGEVSATPCSL